MAFFSGASVAQKAVCATENPMKSTLRHWIQWRTQAETVKNPMKSSSKHSGRAHKPMGMGSRGSESPGLMINEGVNTKHHGE